MRTCRFDVHEDSIFLYDLWWKNILRRKRVWNNNTNK